MSIYHRIYSPIQTHRIDIREDASSHKAIWCKYLSSSLCTAVERTSQIDSGSLGSSSSTHSYLFALVAQKVERFLVSGLHTHPRRAGNYTCLLSNTALLLSIDLILLVLFQHHLIPCDSKPLPLFQFSYFWRQSFTV